MNADHDDREEALTKRAAQERLLISKLSREDLEDKYLKLYDENILLKKHCRKQEEKIKKMATKLLRLVNDRKRATNALISGSPSNIQANKKIMREVENEELIVDLQQKLTESEMQNKRLRENLQTSKIQLQTLQSQKKTIYNSVNARIDTGLPKKTNKNIRTISTNLPRQTHYPQQNYIFEELNVEKEELENAIESLENEIVQYKSEIDSLKYQLKEKELNYEEDLLNLKNRASLDHKQNLQENIDLIRLQREIKEKSNQYTELHQKFTNLSQQHLQLKDTHDSLLNEVERYHQQLKQEQQKTLSLRTELKNLSQGNREIMELKERIEDLNRDNEILKEANEKLLNNAFNLEREREFREKEKAYKIQIAQLEATLKSDVGEKGSILDKLSIERSSYDKLNTEYRDMQVKYYEMKQQYDEINEKLMFLNQEGNFDFKEVEEALIVIKERKSRRDNGFLNEFEDGKNRHYQRKMAELETNFAETARELEKTRHLLVTQVKINDDYKKEVQLIQAKMEEHKSEFDKKELETAQLLDIRAARIKKLERQLKDIAYGTKQVRVTSELGLLPSEKLHEDIEMPDQQQVAQLDRGQNIFEIHLTRLVLTDEALKILHEAEPSTFCTIEFYEHELQTSPIIKSAKPEYNFTSQYVIKVDDFFLHYLQKNTSTIELHQTVGSDYRTLAACQISFREIIDRNIPRLNGTVRLISVDERNVGVTFGTLEYWANLIMPVDQAFRLYKERTKALGYISTNIRAMNEADKKFSQSAYNSEIKKPESVDNMNELNVNILRCTNVHGKEKARQPAAYCIYRFYDFKDHDTEIITASNYPEFNDHKSFAVQMDVDVDRYLRKESLLIYIFDDNQAENDPDYLGVVKVPLLPLAHNKDIKGTFEIARPDGRNNGSIDVSIYWQYIYLPPAASALNTKDNNKSKSLHKTNISIASNNNQILTKEKEYSKVKYDDKSHHETHFDNQDAHFDHPKPQNGASKHSKKKSIDSIKSVTSNASVVSRQSNVSNQQKERATSPVQQKISSRRSSISSHISHQDSANMTIKNEEQSPSTHHNDTYFADEHRTGSPNDWGSIQHEYRHLTNEDLATTLESTTGTQNLVQNNVKVSQSDNYEDDEDVVVTPKSSWNNTLNTFKKSDKVVLEIEDFQIDNNCDALHNDDIKQIFASITFLDYEPAELETPSEPKPGPNQKVTVKFRKVFDVDSRNNFEARQKLATALQDEKKGIIIFSIVAEPEDEDVECEDICFGYINIRDIMQSNRDLKGHQITLKDSKNQNKSVGYMTINVEMLDALNAINEEIEPSETQ